MEKAKLDRINYLYHKKQTEGLTAEEAEERAALHQEYLLEIRLSFGSTLEHTVIKRPDGTVEQVKERKKKQ